MTVRDAYNARVAAGELRPDPGQSRAVEQLVRLHDDLMQPAPKSGFFRKSKPVPVKGLYLWGDVGRGKSMLMDLAVSEAAVPTRRVHFHGFMEWVHDRMNAARKRGVEDAIAPVAQEVADEVRLLAFDEMQIKDVADAMIVGRLFQGLFDQGVTVVSTSNRPPDDLYKDGLNRQIFLPFIDLIKDRMAVHHLASDTDYRQEVLAGEPRYFSPLGPESRGEMDRIWHELTGGAAEEMHLTVKGRRVTLPAYHNGCARARFHDLCGQPLGAADYLAITDAVRVLMLDDVPRLGRSNFNEAKRFVTLLDALYESRTRLFASAADVPEQLYLEGEGAFEFDRAASRLREMQGKDWGQGDPAPDRVTD